MRSHRHTWVTDRSALNRSTAGPTAHPCVLANTNTSPGSVVFLVAALASVLTAASLNGAKLPPLIDGQTTKLQLEGGAAMRSKTSLQMDVLELDGRKGSYAHCPIPHPWGRLRNFRVQVKVRLDRFKASSVPIAWPGAFMIYFNSQGHPWFLFFTDDGRHIYSYDEPITPTVWTDIAFEYRADDICLMYINGRSVRSWPGRGQLTEGGEELWFGRYHWQDDEGKEYHQWMRGAVARPEITVLPDDDQYRPDLSGMTNCMRVSWGDAIVVGEGWRKLNKLEHVAPFVQECKRLGVTKVLFRCSSKFITRDYEHRMPEDHWYMGAIRSVEGDIHAEVIRQCHDAGITVYAWSTIFDEGSPPSVKYGGNAPFPWQSRFTIEHPEYLMESRDGQKRMWGVLCYAYPEARHYMIDKFRYLMDNWDFDGLYICTRTHSKPAEHADQFGYNEPIVREFERRHGVDIRTEEFSRPQWWSLIGEYLTELLRDFRKAFPDSEIIFGMPRSDYIGPPYGNWRLDWRTWTRQGLIDGLLLGTISGGWHYPDSRNRPGYVQSQQDDIAIRPLEYDLGEWFGPACGNHGCDLYLQSNRIFADAERQPLDNPGMTGFALTFRPK